jgi:calpain-15
MGACCSNKASKASQPTNKPKPSKSSAHPILKAQYKDAKIFQFVDLSSTSYFDAVGNIILRLQKNNSLYEDMTFPPAVASLTSDAYRFKRANNYVWMRPSQFLLNNALTASQVENQPKVQEICLFKSKIEPSDIRQGELGDCYFLSALTVMAENPRLIERLFESEVYNEQGCYAIWLCINGEWKQYIVDDNIPCINGTSMPAFTRANGSELWVLLLEKAYAKAFASYENIEAGLAAEALRDLTGAPGEYLMFPTEEAAWDFLRKWDKQGFMLTASTENFEGGKEEKELLDLGLVEGHCYAILDVRETRAGSEVVKRIFIIF